MSRVRFHNFVWMCFLVGCVGPNQVGADTMPIHAFRPVVAEPLPSFFAYGDIPGPVVLKGRQRIDLAVPSIGSAARVSERFEDILPVAERPFQIDRIWGYWPGYDRSIYPFYWGGAIRSLDRDRGSTTAVPEPGTLLMMGLGGVLLLRRRSF